MTTILSSLLCMFNIHCDHHVEDENHIGRLGHGSHLPPTESNSETIYGHIVQCCQCGREIWKKYESRGMD